MRGYQLGLISRTGDVEAALSGFAYIIDTYQATMGEHYTRSGMFDLVACFVRLGYHDGAARLHGAVTRGLPDTWIELYPEVSTRLPDVMGDEAFAAAFDAGATLAPHAAGELARQLLAQVRADQLGT